MNVVEVAIQEAEKARLRWLWANVLSIPERLKCKAFFDWSRNDFLMQKGLRTYVDPSWDAKDGVLMREIAWQAKYGRDSVARKHFCRAFVGIDFSERLGLS